jgi:hypothetical protein
MVAEVDMPRGAGPAAGEGFNDLAGYIFGGNNRCGAVSSLSCTLYMTCALWTLVTRSWGAGGSV